MAIDNPRATTAYAANRYAPRPAAPGTPVGRSMSAKQLQTVESVVIEIHKLERELLDLTPVSETVTSQMIADMRALYTPTFTVQTIQWHLNRTDVAAYGESSLVGILLANVKALRGRVAAIRSNRADTTVHTSNPVVPQGYYALEYAGSLRFYRIVEGTGKWSGRTFVNRYKSDDLLYVTRQESSAILAALQAEEAQQEARATFARETVHCYMCARKLTDETSRALGIGPDCRKKG